MNKVFINDKNLSKLIEKYYEKQEFSIFLFLLLLASTIYQISTKSQINEYILTYFLLLFSGIIYSTYDLKNLKIQ
jgi:hypothetical protein